jgi:hypothetical protein
VKLKYEEFEDRKDDALELHKQNAEKECDVTWKKAATAIPLIVNEQRAFTQEKIVE